jgi:hypothetical protein
MTMRHTCHAIWCKNACPPAHLTCRDCWKHVSPATAAEVYRTVKLRDMGGVDATWAPWWRAQAKAIHEIAVAQDIEAKVNATRHPPMALWSLEAWMSKELRTAAELEAMGT